MKRILAALLVLTILLAALPTALAAEEAAGGIAAGMEIKQVTPQTVAELLTPAVPKRAATRAVGDSIMLPSLALGGASILKGATSTVQFSAMSAGNPAPEWGYVELYKGDALNDPDHASYVTLLHCKRIPAKESVENINCTLQTANLPLGTYTLVGYVSDRGDQNGEILGDPYGVLITIVDKPVALQRIYFAIPDETGSWTEVTFGVFEPGEVSAVCVMFEPANATVDRGVTFSMGSSVIAMEVIGSIAGLQAEDYGNALLTAKSTATGKTITMPLYVSKPVTGIALDWDTYSICPDHQVTLHASLFPADAEAPIIWTTSNSAVATVKDGIVKTVGPGTAVITADCWDHKASCTFTVGTHDDGESRYIAPTATRNGGTVATCKLCDVEHFLNVEQRIFGDTYDTAFYADAVDYCYANGIIKGTKADRFSPDMNMTRGMLVAVLYRAEGSPQVDTLASFPDVSEKQYYAPAVVWASKNELVTGYGNGQFMPDRNITREEIATLMRRYAAYKGQDTTVEGSHLAEFPDRLAQNYWSYDAVNWAVSIGLINGNKVAGKVYLQPFNNATRAQVATILYRFIQMDSAETD